MLASVALFLVRLCIAVLKDDHQDAAIGACGRYPADMMFCQIRGVQGGKTLFSVARKSLFMRVVPAVLLQERA